MKDIIIWVAIVVFIVAFFLGFGYIMYNIATSNPNEKITENLSSQKVVEAEGCQYYKIPSSYGFWAYTHKGNCTNSIHVYK
jgi:uncharacterized protein YxeA